MEERVLKVAVTPILGIFDGHYIGNGSSEFVVTGGNEFDLLKMMAQGLGCSYRTYVPDDVDWGFRNQDGSWTGVMGMVARREVDMALSHMYLILEREEFAYSFPYHEVRFTFATSPPEEVHSPMSFVHVFGKYLWVALVVVLLVLPVVLRLVLSGRRNVVDLFFKALASLVQQGTDFEARRLGDRVLVSHWLLCAVCLSLIYASALFSFLTVPTKGEGVRDLRALLSATKAGKMRSIAVEGKGTVHFFAKSDDPIVSELFTIIARHADWDIPSDPELVRKTVFADRDAVILSDDHMKLLLGRNAFISGDSVARYHIAVFLARDSDSDLQERVNRVVHRIVAAGVLRKMSDHYLLRKSPSLYWYKPPVERERVLTLETLSGPFVLLAAGHAMAACALCVELLVALKMKKKRSTTNDGIIGNSKEMTVIRERGRDRMQPEQNRIHRCCIEDAKDGRNQDNLSDLRKLNESCGATIDNNT